MSSVFVCFFSFFLSILFIEILGRSVLSSRFCAVEEIFSLVWLCNILLA